MKKYSLNAFLNFSDTRNPIPASTNTTASTTIGTLSIYPISVEYPKVAKLR